MGKAAGAVLYQCSEAVDSESRHVRKTLNGVKSELQNKKTKPSSTSPDSLFWYGMKLNTFSKTFLLKTSLKSACMVKPKTIIGQSMDLFGSVCQKMYLLGGTHLRLGFHQQCLILIQVHMAL